MMSLITSLLPIAIQIIGYFLSKSNADNSTKQKWFDFMHAIDADTNSSAALRKRAMDQKQRILDSLNKPVENKS
jgi:hypothetical protein